jgi:hypothetical protein
MRLTHIFLVAAVVLGGCATLEPIVPAGYAGPTVEIGEDGSYEDSTKGQLFYVESIDGKTVDQVDI